MARRFTRTRGQSGAPRKTMWLDIAPTRTVLAAATTAALVNVGATGFLEQRPFTIVRTRGFISLASDQDSAAEAYDAGIGMAIVQRTATNIGVTAVPTPLTDLSSDAFFMLELMGGLFTFVSGVGVDAQGLGAARKYDSRAMRKVADEEDIAVTIETSGISLGCTLYHVGRVLIKLH